MLEDRFVHYYIAPELVIFSIHIAFFTANRDDIKKFHFEIFQGTFPHGIDILTTADYFSVGQVSQATCSVIVNVLKFWLSQNAR